jgi:hypothetical protein
MAIKYGFFNSVGGDRKYNAEDMSEYFDGLISNGVYESIGDKLQVSVGEGMSVNVGTGRAMIDCHWLKNDAVLNLPISQSDVQYDRIDCIAVKLDLTERTMSIEVIEGRTMTMPVTPIRSDTETIKYIWLAYIRINANTTSIPFSRIYDLRGGSLCPWVTGLIKQVDTSQLFAQWQDACESYYNSMTAEMNTYFDNKKAEYEAWFDTLTDTLTVDTYIRKYQNSYEVTSEVTELEIGIPEYDSTKDVLFVNINGVEFIEGVDYQTSTNKIVLSNSIKGTNQMTFIVLKSKIGSST